MQQNPAGSKTPRRISGLFILVIIVAGLALLTYRPPLAHVYCDDQKLAAEPDVILLATSWCTYCYEARLYFENNNVHYCEYDIEKSTIGRKLYDDVNAQSVPTLLIGQYRISGFDETRFERLMARLEKQP